MDTSERRRLLGVQALSRTVHHPRCSSRTALAMATTDATTPTVATPVTVNDMWKLFAEQVRTDEEEWVLEEVVTILKSTGITAPWQLKKAPDALSAPQFSFREPRKTLFSGHTRQRRDEDMGYSPTATRSR